MVTDNQSNRFSFMFQHGGILRAFVFGSQVNEFFEPGIKESFKTRSGSGFIITKSGIFPSQEPAWNNPIGLRDGFFDHGNRK